MKGRHETLGVLYLDTHSTARDAVARNNPTGKFTEDHLALAIAVGHQAALAVEETRYHQAMVQAERLAAIGQTIAALSHHIKNILQGLRSGSDILKMGLSDKDEDMLQQGWRIVEKNQVKIYDLVMDMLSFSKEREPAIEDTDLNQVVRDVLELLAGRARDLGAKVETRLDPDLPHVQVDPEGLHRALLNIIGNAFDAVEERRSPHVAVVTKRDPDEGWVRILVLDNGPGIPAEKLADIFKPFVSTKGSKGTGLGLAVSRKIFREHGGDIQAQSQPGKSTTFILRLPLRSPLSSEAVGTHSELPIPPLPESGQG
jgi:signal transduction histidine kinase